MPYLALWVRSVLVVCVLSITSTGSCDELSSGVQAFFDGNNELAVTTLTQVVEQSQAPPRAFFFRGLANQRLGDLQAAIADFKHGASLEITRPDKEVGSTLERVQGAERLQLEKYRTLARLSARIRRQPIAPAPAVERPENATTAIRSTEIPIFRLASEIPLRRQVAEREFWQRQQELLADESMPGGPEVPEDSTPESEPVGTGIVAADEVGDNEFDPFFDDEGDQADASVATLSDDAPASANPTARANPTGVMGAIFRAISRATIPNLNPTQMLPGAQEGPLQGAEYDPNDDPFGDVGDSTDGAFDFEQ